ncbi:Adenylate cyclase [Mycena sanguinolenta]|uniref:Adenylate cyclase n=1 Tax=Mycena sanguinolenta TaxID=230812 RepID=A0A8H7CN35_9AGAR|nr:Adenylate cyclase [Mycena sanguinolenta]
MEASTSNKRVRQGSSPPPPDLRLRKSKSSEIVRSVRRKVSLKHIHFLGRNSTDETEHPSLRAPNTSNTTFQPPASYLPKPTRWPFKFGRRPKRSAEDAPPMPSLPVDAGEHSIELPTNPNPDEWDMKEIIDHAMVYGDGNSASSPGTLNSSSRSGRSSSRHGRPKLRTPVYGASSAPPLRSPDPVGPTDISGVHKAAYHVPDSWAVTPAQPDADEDSTSDNARPSHTEDLPRWKIRIYGQDNNEYTLRITANDTVASLMPQLDAKLPPKEERETHELYLKGRGGERILRPSERPVIIVRRCLQQAGYDESDGDGGVGRGTVGLPSVPFLLKFIYRSQFLGPADEELSFSNFVYVNLSGRSLVTIPVVLHRHAETIVSLRLSRNPMIEIPLDFIQSCTALSEIFMNNMFMNKVPQSIRHSATLTLLDLSSNRISSLDEAGLDELPRLATLDIQNNRLAHLPDVLPRSLLNLNISNNKFDVFPVTTTQLTHLSRLDISFNSILELPPEISRLTRLTEFVIVGNQISALPAEFGNLALLRDFDCRRNQIADLAVAYGLPELESLSADHNNLHNLAFSLGPHLTELDVSHNDITELLVGCVHKTPPALTFLDISCAKLSVLDDATLAQLLSLRTLKLDHNSFRALPESLGDLKWLEILSCADNALTELPESIGRLQKLESLDLHSNSLTGLPVSIWNCASLLRLNVTSNLLTVWHDPPPFAPDPNDLPAVPTGKSLATSPIFTLRRPSVPSRPDIPPARPLPRELRVLNLSLNVIQELPSDFFGNLTQLEEVYLSGNRLTHIPSEDLPRLERLSTLFLNGNHLKHLPHELGKVKSLTLLDVGNNQLKYNINNLDYDWNWNFNKNLVYLNLSGNKQLQIKSDVSNRLSTSSAQRQSFSGFSGLSQLRVLGLMDVTITSTSRNTGSDIPDESEDRRVRTSSSLVNGLSYGIADTLGKNRHPLMMDLVHEFRGIKKETVFAMFGRSHPASLTVATTSNGLPKYLKDNFIRVFVSQLSSLDRLRGEDVPDALRRSFLKLNQDYYEFLFGPARKMSLAGGPGVADAALVSNGASGIVVYIDIVNKRMYVANVGNALAIISRAGIAHPVSRKHEPHDRAETARIRAAEGWISPPGLVNNELDISRSFGFYHLLPALNARPDISEYELTNMDDMVIIANRGLWDYVEYQLAVDILRRGEGSTMIMVVSLASLFHDKTDAAPVDQRRPRGPRVPDRILDRLKDEVAPPTGHVAVVFTDIQNSTRLWEATPSGMIAALHLHNTLLRRCLRLCGGYEVRTEGDSFMCSFPTVLAAVRWSLIIQVQLLKVSWPQDILDCADGKEVFDVDGRLLYRGLSVRVGINCGRPLCQTDPVTNRMDYFGLMVTRAARMASVAAGGQIMCSADVLTEINARVFETEPFTEYSDSQPKDAIEAIRQLQTFVEPVGEVKLKGLEAPEMLSVVLPGALRGRITHLETVVVNPPPSALSPGLAAPLRSPFPSNQVNTTQVRELALLCIRLEVAMADPVLCSTPDKLEAFKRDFEILLPSDADMTDGDVSTILYSLTVRLENVATVLQSKSGDSRLLTKTDLVSALRDLDERTLEEVWSMLHEN